MPKKIKSESLPPRIAAELFASLNKEYVQLKFPTELDCNQEVSLICELNPNDDRLIYPDGWWFSDGYFRNERHAPVILFRKPNGLCWMHNDEAWAIRPSEMSCAT
ncbi:MAG: hypothetical protein IKE01_05085 [Clostridia bacterium]|nr:hypothetical protein [Clostridia bacterium]